MEENVFHISFEYRQRDYTLEVRPELHKGDTVYHLFSSDEWILTLLSQVDERTMVRWKSDRNVEQEFIGAIGDAIKRHYK